MISGALVCQATFYISKQHISTNFSKINNSRFGKMLPSLLFHNFLPKKYCSTFLSREEIIIYRM